MSDVTSGADQMEPASNSASADARFAAYQLLANQSERDQLVYKLFKEVDQNSRLIEVKELEVERKDQEIEQLKSHLSTNTGTVQPITSDIATKAPAAAAAPPPASPDVVDAWFSGASYRLHGNRLMQAAPQLYWSDFYSDSARTPLDQTLFAAAVAKARSTSIVREKAVQPELDAEQREQWEEFLRGTQFDGVSPLF